MKTKWTMEQLCEPNHAYVGKSGPQRFLVARGEEMADGSFKVKADGTSFQWIGAKSKKPRTCWVSTWMEWVRERVEADQ